MLQGRRGLVPAYDRSKHHTLAASVTVHGPRHPPPRAAPAGGTPKQKHAALSCSPNTHTDRRRHVTYIPY
jgi:hypothetical protein